MRGPDWEYRIERLDDPGELRQEWLNERGAEGWELTAITPVAGSGLMLVFKRRRPPGPPPPPPR